MDLIDNLLTRGVDKIYPNREALERVFRSNKKITLYQGFDPSGARLHIGHAVALRKLRQFQELGHKVIFLIGDFTGLIGDPTGKSEGRKPLTRKQVLENAKDYKKQASKILRFDGDNPVEIKFNNEWLSKLTFEEILRLASHFSVQQMIERDMFQTRIKRGDVIGLQEFLYPLMQGYDSVAMNVDLELGGTDQTFNMLAGRKLVSQILHKEKFVMTVPLLTDSKGVKIGKTEDNVIGLTDPPIEFYGKIMSLGDDSIIPCFTLLTNMPDSDISAIRQAIKQGKNPMSFKKQLAFELTKQFNSESDAVKAQNEFESIFQKKEIGKADIPIVSVEKKTWNLLELLVAIGIARSKSEARRLLIQKAVEINGVIYEPPEESEKLLVTLKNGDIIKVGKKRFMRIHT